MDKINEAYVITRNNNGTQEVLSEATDFQKNLVITSNIAEPFLFVSRTLAEITMSHMNKVCPGPEWTIIPCMTNVE